MVAGSNPVSPTSVLPGQGMFSGSGERVWAPIGPYRLALAVRCAVAGKFASAGHRLVPAGRADLATYRFSRLAAAVSNPAGGTPFYAGQSVFVECPLDLGLMPNPLVDLLTVTRAGGVTVTL